MDMVSVGETGYVNICNFQTDRTCIAALCCIPNELDKFWLKPFSSSQLATRLEWVIHTCPWTYL